LVYVQIGISNLKFERLLRGTSPTSRGMGGPDARGQGHRVGNKVRRKVTEACLLKKALNLLAGQNVVETIQVFFC
jgi:hypothetical protein